MKKLIIGATVTVLVLSAGATTAFAAGGRHHGMRAVSNVGQGSGLCQSGYSCFVDTNGDGVCDYHGSNCRYVDADGDGVCDYHGTNCRYTDADGDGVCDYHGSNCWYLDADNDGVCDNRGTGLGVNYVDANGDGVCDNLGTSCHNRQSWGGGHHGRW